MYSTAELKVGQEFITLMVFMLFSYFYLGEAIKWSTVAGFGLIIAGVAVIFYFR